MNKLFSDFCFFLFAFISEIFYRISSTVLNDICRVYGFFYSSFQIIGYYCQYIDYVFVRRICQFNNQCTQCTVNIVVNKHFLNTLTYLQYTLQRQYAGIVYLTELTMPDIVFFIQLTGYCDLPYVLPLLRKANMRSYNDITC